MSGTPNEPFAGVRRWIRRHPSLHRAVLRLLAPAVARLLASRVRWREQYHRWIKAHDTLSAADIAAIHRVIEGLDGRPLISVAMAVHDAPADLLGLAIASVRAQLWPDWELCLCDDASAAAHVGRTLREEAAADGRIRWVRRAVRGGVGAATNDAMALASGTWVVPMNAVDLLPARALYEIGLAASEHPEAALIYCDEDKIDRLGRRFDPYFKSDFDRDLMLARDLIGRGCAFRADVLRAAGGYGDRDHDVALRVLARTDDGAVLHVPGVLYHRRWERGSGSPFDDVSVEAVRDFLDRTGCGDRRVVMSGDRPRVVHPVPEPAPLVSVIVPTRDKAVLLGPCAEGLLRRTDYPAIEVLIADNGSTEPATLALFRRWRGDKRVRVLPMPGPFNYARLNNRAVAEANGAIVLLLNNDTETIEPGWLAEMVSHAIRPGVGAVGAMLYYANDTVQHAGVVLGMTESVDGVAGHMYRDMPRGEAGPFGLLSAVRGVSAVTAACLAVRRDLYLAIGGLNEKDLTVAFNDVDFCLRLREAGYRNRWTPFAALYHKESASRGDDATAEKKARFAAEVAYMRRRWGEQLDNDPFWNPFLSINGMRRRLSLRPRQARSWVGRAA